MRRKSKKLKVDGALRARLTALGIGEVLFEFHNVGKSVRVTAIDPRSGTEVVTICPSSHSEEAMKRTSASKLAYVLEKKRKEIEGGDSFA